MIIKDFIVRKSVELENTIKGATDEKSLLDVSNEPKSLIALPPKIKQPSMQDYSHWETIEDWNALANSVDRPLLFGTKATEGTYYKDPTFPEYFTKAKTILGSRRLAYHFFRKAYNPTTQANWFVDYIEPYLTNDDILCLDVEEGGEKASQLWAFIERVKQRRPNNLIIIYSGKFILNAIVMTEGEKAYFRKIKTWIANYPSNPDDYDTIPSWVNADPDRYGEVIAWQYSDNGKVTGVKEEVDLNMMSPEFIAYLGGSTPPPEPPPEPPPVEGEKLYVGKIKASATPYVILRDAPAGNDILHLFPNTPIEGKGELVYANNYWRMQLTSPNAGWIASEFLDYQIVGELPPPVPEDVITYPHDGVEYHQLTRFGYKTFVVIIDMNDSKKRAHVTNTKGNLITTGVMARKSNAQIAINGDGWAKVAPYVPLGIAVSDGDYFNNVKTGVPFLNISSTNKLDISYNDYGGLYNTTSGFRHLIEDGIKKDYLYLDKIQYTERHPRGAKGITNDGRLILIGCEGRNSVGLGITLSELADIFLEFDTKVAFDSDSGGSFTLVMDGVLQNVPSNPNGEERAVVSHLLIFIDDDTGGEIPTLGNLKLTTNEAGIARSVRRDAPVGQPHIFGSPFTSIPANGYAIATDTYEYTNNVITNGNVTAKAGDIWYLVSEINGEPITGSAWTAGIHLGRQQVIVESIIPTPDPDPDPTPDFPDHIFVSIVEGGEQKRYNIVP